jgi:anti-sigma regulatory factor (Ser/Thr protein kinase)
VNGTTRHPSLTLKLDTLTVRKLGPWISESLDSLGVENRDTLLPKLELALHELCMNVIDHSGLTAHDELWVGLRVDQKFIHVRIEDSGIAYAVGAGLVLDTISPQERGYGLMIVRGLVDELICERVADTNISTLRIRRHPDRVSGSTSTGGADE